MKKTSNISRLLVLMCLAFIGFGLHATQAKADDAPLNWYPTGGDQINWYPTGNQAIDWYSSNDATQSQSGYSYNDSQEAQPIYYYQTVPGSTQYYQNASTTYNVYNPYQDAAPVTYSNPVAYPVTYYPTTTTTTPDYSVTAPDVTTPVVTPTDPSIGSAGTRSF
jgi:hypothetical protein